MSGLKQALIGCVEMALFMPDPGQWFDNTARALRRSFLVPLFVLLVYTLAIYKYDMTSITIGTWMVSVIFMYLAGLTFCLVKFPLFILLAWVGAKAGGAQGSFRHFLIANNWFHLVSIPGLFPVWWQINAGVTGTEILAVVSCSLFYCYLALAIMSSKILKMSIELSALIPLASMVANGMFLVFLGKMGGMWIF